MSGRSIHLIDRDELLATLEQDIDVSVTGQENMKVVQKCLQEILDDVKGSPVVDAVEVVRCKDCKHWNTKDGQFKDFDGKEWHHCECFREFTDEDGDSPVTPSYFYCMNAERKEE